MKTKLILLTTAAALGCSLSLLPAQDAPKPPAAPEGKEAPAPPPPPEGGPAGEGRSQRMEEMFKRIDTNGDGKISKEEYMDFSKKEAEERFSKMDPKNVGSLDKAQLEEAMRSMRQNRGGERGERGADRARTGNDGFRRPDSAGDGNGTRPRPSGDGSASASPPGEGGGRRGGGGGSAMGELYRKLQDGGTVTREEFTKMSEEQFKHLDTNGDGKITKEELEEAMRSMRQNRGGRGEGGRGGPGARPEGQGGGGFRRPSSTPTQPPAGT